MNDFTFTKEAFSQYVYWQTKDKKVLRKINNLLEDIRRNGAMQGMGKPETLKYRPGYSRRIDKENRLIYLIDKRGNIVVISCQGHYE